MGGVTVKRAVLYLRVSTAEQTTANQERELREVASRIGCEIVKVCKDHGISGAKGRDCTRTRRSRVPFRLPVARWRCQFWADCTTNISERRFSDRDS
jgi:hypothetical protein